MSIHAAVGHQGAPGASPSIQAAVEHVHRPGITHQGARRPRIWPRPKFCSCRTRAAQDTLAAAGSRLRFDGMLPAATQASADKMWTYRQAELPQKRPGDAQEAAAGCGRPEPRGRAFADTSSRRSGAGVKKGHPRRLRVSGGAHCAKMSEYVSDGAELMCRKERNSPFWGHFRTGPRMIYYYLRSISIEQSLYSAPRSELDRLLGCD